MTSKPAPELMTTGANLPEHATVSGTPTAVAAMVSLHFTYHNSFTILVSMSLRWAPLMTTALAVRSLFGEQSWYGKTGSDSIAFSLSKGAVPRGIRQRA
jgi:hypothetical protein